MSATQPLCKNKGRGLPAAATWKSPVGSASPTGGAILRPPRVLPQLVRVSGTLINHGDRTQGGDTCNSALCSKKPSKKLLDGGALLDGDLPLPPGHGQQTRDHSVCALSLKAQGSSRELLQSLLILKMGMMMKTDPWLPPCCSLGFVAKVNSNYL